MTAALRRWFIGADLDWRAYGIATPVYVGGDSTVTASFTVNSSGKTFTVNGSGSTATGSTITGYGWDFGDGGTAAGVQASHTYATAGTFTVALTVTDDQDNSSTVQQTVTVMVPTAAFTWTASASTATFDASTSTEANATITGYAWTFGDGTTGTGKTVPHSYATAGTRSVTLTVTDAAGSSDTETQQVTVNLPASNPTAAFTSLVANQVATFDASASTTTNATITGYAWAFGDGATGTGIKPTHTYAVGTWTATLTITDSQGHTATVAHPVTVTTPPNKPPTAAFTITVSGLRASFSAVTSSDGDGSISSYAWTYGDGGTGTGVGPTHDYTASGTFTVRLTVTDNLGATGTTTKTVTVTQPVTTTDYLTSTTASTSSTLVPASTAAVLQQLIRSPDTGEFYTSQMHPETDGITESVRLSRLTVAGATLDQMLLTGAGHGTTFALEYSGGQMYVWTNWQRAVVGGPIQDDLVRFPYKAGTYTRAQVTGLTVKVPGPTYRLLAFDWQNGYAVIRTGASSTAATYRRYKLADVLAGNLATALNTITLGEGALGSGQPTLQGFATYAGALFRYTGAPSDNADRANNLPRITEYDWATGVTIRSIDTTAFGGTSQKTEPEGLSVYDNGSNPVLFFGVTQGPTGGPHTYPTWWFPLIDSTTGTQPTGAGISRYQDLTGSTFNARLAAAPASNSVSFPPSTIEFTDFATQTDYGAVYAGHGLLGSGPTVTVLRMAAGTSTKAALVPTASGTTNPLYLIRSTNTTSGVRYDGFHLQGTSQGHLYNGLRVSSQVAPVLNNMKVSAIPGNAAVNPGETFHVNLANCSGVKASNVTLDGAGVGASGFGANSCTGGQTYTDITVTGMKYCKAWAGWQCTGGATFTRFTSSGNAFAFGFERCSGTYTLNGCTFGTATRADIHLASDTTARATVVINDPVLPAGKTQIKVLLSTSELGNPNLQTRSDVKVYVGGVDKSSTMLTFVTSA